MTLHFQIFLCVLEPNVGIVNREEEKLYFALGDGGLPQYQCSGPRFLAYAKEYIKWGKLYFSATVGDWCPKVFFHHTALYSIYVCFLLLPAFKYEEDCAARLRLMLKLNVVSPLTGQTKRKGGLCPHPKT